MYGSPDALCPHAADAGPCCQLYILEEVPHGGKAGLGPWLALSVDRLQRVVFYLQRDLTAGDILVMGMITLWSLSSNVITSQSPALIPLFVHVLKLSHWHLCSGHILKCPFYGGFWLKKFEVRWPEQSLKFCWPPSRITRTTLVSKTCLWVSPHH